MASQNQTEKFIGLESPVSLSQLHTQPKASCLRRMQIRSICACCYLMQGCVDIMLQRPLVVGTMLFLPGTDLPYLDFWLRLGT